jgi:hypothetical protein
MVVLIRVIVEDSGETIRLHYKSPWNLTSPWVCTYILEVIAPKKIYHR